MRRRKHVAGGGRGSIFHSLAAPNACEPNVNMSRDRAYHSLASPRPLSRAILSGSSPRGYRRQCFGRRQPPSFPLRALWVSVSRGLLELPAIDAVPTLFLPVGRFLAVEPKSKPSGCGGIAARRLFASATVLSSRRPFTPLRYSPQRGSLMCLWPVHAPSRRALLLHPTIGGSRAARRLHVVAVRTLQLS